MYVISAKLTDRLQKLRKLISRRSFNPYTMSAKTRLDEVRLWMVATTERVTNSVDFNTDMTALTDLQPTTSLASLSQR
jgi:hypothetical protein